MLPPLFDIIFYLVAGRPHRVRTASVASDADYVVSSSGGVSVDSEHGRMSTRQKNASGESVENEFDDGMERDDCLALDKRVPVKRR